MPMNINVAIFFNLIVIISDYGTNVAISMGKYMTHIN